MTRKILILLAGVAAAHAAHDPVFAVQGLISRVLGPQALHRFQLEAIAADPSGLDVFEQGSNGSLVVLRGSCGSSLAVALNTYLKYQVTCTPSHPETHGHARAHASRARIAHAHEHVGSLVCKSGRTGEHQHFLGA